MADIGGRLGVGWEWEVECISGTSICSHGDSRAFWDIFSTSSKPFSFAYAGALFQKGVSVSAFTNSTEPNMDGKFFHLQSRNTLQC